MIDETFKQMAAKADPTKKYDLDMVGYFTYCVKDHESGVALTGALPHDEAQRFLVQLKTLNGW